MSDFEKGDWVELANDKKVYWTPAIYIHRLATIVSAGSRGKVISDGAKISGQEEVYYDVEFIRPDGWICEVRCEPDELVYAWRYTPKQGKKEQ